VIEVSRAMLHRAYAAVGQVAPELTTPAERVALLAGLVPPLLRLDGGAARLAEWTPRVGPTESPADLRRRLRKTLAVFGDGPMADVLIDCLAATVPPVVREFVVAEVVFVLCGWETRGWMSRLALPPLPRLVVLNGAGRDAGALALLACHEIVHAWHARPGAVDELPTLSAPHEQLVMAVAHEGAWPALDQIPIRERTTDATALSWFCAATSEARSSDAGRDHRP
jgi:hypothetical protein